MEAREVDCQLVDAARSCTDFTVLETHASSARKAIGPAYALDCSVGVTCRTPKRDSNPKP